MSPRTVPPSGLTEILVVEDDREMQYLFQVILAQDDREIHVAGTGAEAEAILAERDIDLVILDLILPDTDGRSLLTRMREDRDTAGTPVICVTSNVGADVRADCFARGAEAFVEKPFDAKRVATDIGVVLERYAAQERRIHEDDLTGLLNRAGFLDHLEDRPAGEAFGIIALQLDSFRRISDRWGWGTGERVVYEVARALESALPEGSVLARLGGAEYAVTTVDDVAALGAVLVETVRDLPIEGPDRETFRITASAGVTPVEEGETRIQALDRAQSRLFQARDAGGNRMVQGEATEGQGSRRILVAEDDDITATILGHRLAKEGFEVARFANGRDAYNAAMDETPGLVILDVKMPGMDGFEVLERLRKTPAYARVPIVILSSMGSEADVVRGFELGADDYILKPFSPAELIARARRLMARGHVPEEG